MELQHTLRIPLSEEKNGNVNHYIRKEAIPTTSHNHNYRNLSAYSLSFISMIDELVRIEAELLDPRTRRGETALGVKKNNISPPTQ